MDECGTIEIGPGETDLRRKLRAFASGGLFFRMLTRY